MSDRTRWSLAAGLIASVALALAGGSQAQPPADGSIVVDARLADGTVPDGATCAVYSVHRVQKSPQPVLRRAEDAIITGGDGEWVISGLREGDYTIEVTADDWAWSDAVNQRRARVRAGQEESVTLTLFRGGTASGRVVAADTGQPIEGVLVSAVTMRCSATTDVQGRYTLLHVPPGKVTVSARVEAFCPAASAEFEVAEDGKAVLADIELQRAGWISGRVELPDAVPNGHILSGGVVAEPDEDWLPGLTGSRTEQLSRRENGAFRLGPLPPGTYTLDVRLHSSLPKGSRVEPRLPNRHWRGRAIGVVVEAGQELTNIVIPVADRE